VTFAYKNSQKKSFLKIGHIHIVYHNVVSPSSSTWNIEHPLPKGRLTRASKFLQGSLCLRSSISS
jgi:hypothetical protein